MGRNTARSLRFEQARQSCVMAWCRWRSRRAAARRATRPLADLAQGDRALVGVADALEGLGLGAESHEYAQLVVTRGIAQWFVAEDLAQRRAREVRREHQVDEQALVALTAPGVAPLAALAKRPVATAKDVMILRGVRLKTWATQTSLRARRKLATVSDRPVAR